MNYGVAFSWLTVYICISGVWRPCQNCWRQINIQLSQLTFQQTAVPKSPINWRRQLWSTEARTPSTSNCLIFQSRTNSDIRLHLVAYPIQESRAVARKPRDTAAVVFGLTLLPATVVATFASNGGVKWPPGISRVLEHIATKFQRLQLFLGSNFLAVVLPASWDIDVSENPRWQPKYE